jgi:hypothetical protein
MQDAKTPSGRLSRLSMELLLMPAIVNEKHDTFQKCAQSGNSRGHPIKESEPTNQIRWLLNLIGNAWFGISKTFS